MAPTTILLIYCVLIFCASMLGGGLAHMFRMTHLRTQILMSGVGGLMLGVALLHLLPHAAEILVSTPRATAWMLCGVTVMFLLIRLFHTHDHSVPVTVDGSSGTHPTPEAHHGCQHEHPLASEPTKGLSWSGIFVGLMLHTLVDGVALASSVLADAHHHVFWGLLGLGPFLAVLLHIPLDTFTITSVMNKQGWSRQSQLLASFAFSIVCPLGAIAMTLGASQLASETLLGCGLAISAGFFVCIALADLLPEVAFHDHDRGKLTAMFLLGITVAIGIENLPGHSHEIPVSKSKDLSAANLK